MSHARNKEDVLLQRVFAGIDHGFYVDVGAYLPRQDSNTFLLYKKGWTGLIVEPLFWLIPEFVEQWKFERPRDQLVRGLAGGRCGMHEFYRCNALQMSTGSVKLIEEWRETADIGSPDLVPVYTLDFLMLTRTDKAVQLLSIDVEGMEAEVLAGLDLQTVRPWVIVIECMKPGTQEDVSADWVQIIHKAGYSHVYSDEANLWFLAEEYYGDLHRKFREAQIREV